MNYNYSSLIRKFARHGVLHREMVKNDKAALLKLVGCGFVRKTYNAGRVFYEFTEKALPLLEHQRKTLLEEAQMGIVLEKKNSFYSALVHDIRFLDTKRPEAEEFLFLGDWHLTRSVVPAQLELAQLRFYHDQVPKRVKRTA